MMLTVKNAATSNRHEKCRKAFTFYWLMLSGQSSYDLMVIADPDPAQS
jgi:hypothetical protein